MVNLYKTYIFLKEKYDIRYIKIYVCKKKYKFEV